jgi:alanyl-tRNA synthetase
MQLNEQNPTPEMLIARTRQELETGYKKELEELRNAMKQKEEETEKKQYDETVSGFKSQINDFLSSNAETYELINMNDAQGLVFDVIQEYYESSGRILSIEEAAKHTEEHLEAEAKKIMEAKKFKQTSKPASEQEQKATQTLSNTQSAEVPTSGQKKLSREESLAQAAKMIRWNE